MLNIAAPTQIDGMPSPFFIMLNFTELFIGSSGLLPKAAVLLPTLFILYHYFSFSILCIRYLIWTNHDICIRDGK